MDQSNPPVNPFAALVIGPLITGFCVLSGVYIAQWLTHAKSLERERKAELRKAMAEFAAAGFSALITKSRMNIAVSKAAGFLSNKKLVGKEVVEEARDEALEAGDDYWGELDRLVEARCKLLLLELEPSRQSDAEGLYSRILEGRSKASEATGPDKLHVNRLEIPNLKKEIDEWIQAQSKRTDL